MYNNIYNNKTIICFSLYIYYTNVINAYFHHSATVGLTRLTEYCLVLYIFVKYHCLSIYISEERSR